MHSDTDRSKGIGRTEKLNKTQKHQREWAKKGK